MPRNNLYKSMAAGVLFVFSLVPGSKAWAQGDVPLPIPGDAPLPISRPSDPPLTLEQLSVGDRLLPEYNAPGIRYGDIIYKPVIDFGESFDSNIFGSHDLVRSDFYTWLRPEFHAATDWGTNALNLDVTADLDKYAAHGSEDVANMTAEAGGRLDIHHDQYLQASAGYSIQHEPRYSAESEAAAQFASGSLVALYPTQYSVASGRFSYVYVPRRIGFALDGSVDDYQYSNEPTSSGVLAINSDRDRAEFALSPRVSYELQQGTQVFAQVAGNRRQYDSTVDATPDHFMRTSTGYTAAVGADLNEGGIVSGRFYVGYQDQRYDDPRLTDNAGLYLGGSLVWNVTRLTSLKLLLSRDVQETIQTGSSGFWATVADARVEHELMRNVVLSSDGFYELDQYQGIGRNDNMVALAAGAHWKINANLSTGLTGMWQNRQSNQSVNSFEKELLMVDLKLAY